MDECQPLFYHIDGTIYQNVVEPRGFCSSNWTADATSYKNNVAWDNGNDLPLVDMASS